jgi:hypothetical protein
MRRHLLHLFLAVALVGWIAYPGWYDVWYSNIPENYAGQRPCPTSVIPTGASGSGRDISLQRPGDLRALQFLSVSPQTDCASQWDISTSLSRKLRNVQRMPCSSFPSLRVKPRPHFQQLRNAISANISSRYPAQVLILVTSSSVMRRSLGRTGNCSSVHLRVRWTPYNKRNAMREDPSIGRAYLCKVLSARGIHHVDL